MTNIGDIQDAVIKTIRAEGVASCLPDQINVPNGPKNAVATSMMNITFPTNFASALYQSGAGQQTMLVVIDIFTAQSVGREEMDGYVSYIMNLFHPAGKYDGFQVVSRPGFNAFPDDPRGYMVSLNFPVRYTISTP